jgi:hypothetical protein
MILAYNKGRPPPENSTAWHIWNQNYKLGAQIANLHLIIKVKWWFSATWNQM